MSCPIVKCFLFDSTIKRFFFSLRSICINQQASYYGALLPATPRQLDHELRYLLDHPIAVTALFNSTKVLPRK